MNYRAIQLETAMHIKKYGTTISLQRNDVEVAKTFAVFTNGTNNDFGDGSPVTGTISAQRLVLIAGNIKVPPMIGDVIVSSQGTFSILQIEVIQPANLPILFKASISK